MRSCALAVFVKTPELSPVKTRLAAQIGVAEARAVYEHSVAAVSAVAAAAADIAAEQGGRLAPHWAVAEREGLSSPRWDRFPGVFTGEGGLGDRLSHVYSSLLETHGAVALIGSDSPHLRPADLARWCVLDAVDDFTIGPSPDGGFYFFRGTAPLPPKVWIDGVTYSSSGTRVELIANLAAAGHSVKLLESPEDDIDDMDSFRRVHSGLDTGDTLPEQRAMADWVRAQPWWRSAG